ncbi:hypothetical protein QBC32DRAFT_343835 [Pseudoneurospora amorphoporcata]|uniref:BSD domain-containing protein n=1 Tax=Pseudoneurospora amorphoporcata TaxID=241081 RepID=A0AAN6NWM8_9PEZI|nr:hypothetical protein QBC32DRAFT_343835 [Pseudoneurospora amorphoporcata]
MAPVEIPRGRASFKKREGIITLSEDKTALIWSPLPGTGPPVISLSVSNITNLQQTPKTNPKVVLRVVEKPKGPGADPAAYPFQFTHGTEARNEADAIKDILSQIIAELRGDDPSLPKPAKAGPNGAGASAAMAMASAVNSKHLPFRWFEDDMLKADVELQQSLMKKDKTLAQIYNDAKSSKPDSLSDASFNNQFWATRVSLLRAYAIELNQKKGSYNVLSTIKPRTENGELKLNINHEQVQLIFQQHPLVKRIYNVNVPKLTESEFWSRFFLSRLSKKLRGERITDNDNTDPLFDKYLEADNTMAVPAKITATSVPPIINIEANEENQGGFRSGNLKDVEMRPRANIPIIRTLNSLSEKIMANVAPSDVDPSAASYSKDGIADALSQQLALQDLRGDAEAQLIRLSVKDTSTFFTGNQPSLTDQEAADARLYAAQVPSDVLFEVQADMDTLDSDGRGGIDLHRSIGVDPDSEDDSSSALDSKKGPKPQHVGSRASLRFAQTQILDGMKSARSHLTTHGSHTNASEERPMSLPTDLAHRATLTCATTAEFLKQFWTVFNSTSSTNLDPEKAQELAYLADSLVRSRQRIEALAEEAEKRRQEIMEKRKKEIREYYQKTGRKARWVPVGGGRDAVWAVFEGIVKGLERAAGVWEVVSNGGG